MTTKQRKSMRKATPKNKSEENMVASTNQPSGLLTTEEVAQKLRVTTRYLIGLRNDQTPGGPPITRIGRLVRYDANALDQWLRKQTEEF